ncbi:plasmid replication protein RepC [Mangrovicoccus sp. HB161399]|uniref:plasmid replication protein RepC n=1 Tax=Mangrovicoccus sp. HB161399 TaxID=2720392 RepID=UPI001551B7E7|nr:plasmid replication protein RepC [Mangrovicoccus sp. HB161399]
MTHFPEPAIRRGGTGLPSAPGNGALAPHKWRDLMDPLKACASALDLNGTDIHFLDVLLSFVPGDRLATDAGGRCIVFAANATIAARMGRSGDSTVNRCIRRAEERGLVRRVLSPNRKRYCRTGRNGETLRAYGIDLAPLAENHARLMALLAQVEEENARTDTLRRDCAELLAQLKMRGGICDGTLVDFRRRLRRKPAMAALTDLRAELAECIATTSGSAIPGDSADRNEQHIEHHTPNTLESRKAKDDGLREEDIERAFPLLASLLQGRGHQSDFIHRLDAAARMLPGASRAWQRSCSKLGPASASILLGAVLERHDSIANPGGYLRTLTDRCESGELDPGQLVRTSLGRKRPSRAGGMGAPRESLASETA